VKNIATALRRARGDALRRARGDALR
jgi:hypothetical protein